MERCGNIDKQRAMRGRRRLSDDGSPCKQFPDTCTISWHAKNLAEPDLMLAANRANGAADSHAESLRASFPVIAPRAVEVSAGEPCAGEVGAVELRADQMETSQVDCLPLWAVRPVAQRGRGCLDIGRWSKGQNQTLRKPRSRDCAAETDGGNLATARPPDLGNLAPGRDVRV
jgi:hypothetical protein